MSDLINRQDAIDAMSDSLKRVFVEHRDIAEKAIGKLPSTQPEQQWILCSKRLPEWGEEVLTYNEEDEYHINHIMDDDTGEWFYDGVIAWTPLQKPEVVSRSEE